MLGISTCDKILLVRQFAGFEMTTFASFQELYDEAFRLYYHQLVEKVGKDEAMHVMATQANEIIKDFDDEPENKKEVTP